MSQMAMHTLITTQQPTRALVAVQTVYGQCDAPIRVQIMDLRPCVIALKVQRRTIIRNDEARGVGSVFDAQPWQFACARRDAARVGLLRFNGQVLCAPLEMIAFQRPWRGGGGAHDVLNGDEQPYVCAHCGTGHLWRR